MGKTQAQVENYIIEIENWTDLKAEYGYKKCPACSWAWYNEIEDRHGNKIKTCVNCHALYGEFFRLVESYEQVKNRFSDKLVDIDNIRYFDFTGLTSKGMERRHGYYDVTTLLLDQIG